MSCISKINSTFIDDAEDVDTVMPMYSLLEYSDNYSIFWIPNSEFCGITVEMKWVRQVIEW